MDFKKLSSSKIGDAIEAQWRADLAVDRIRIANGQKGSGLTSFLRFLDGLGAISTILVALLIIVSIVLFKTFQFLMLGIGLVFNSPDEKTVKTATIPQFEDTTEEDEREIERLFQELRAEITIADWMNLSDLLRNQGFGVEDYEQAYTLRDEGILYNTLDNRLIRCVPSFSYNEEGELYQTKNSNFYLYTVSVSKIERLYEEYLISNDIEQVGEQLNIHEKIEVLNSGYEYFYEGLGEPKIFSFHEFKEYLSNKGE